MHRVALKGSDRSRPGLHDLRHLCVSWTVTLALSAIRTINKSHADSGSILELADDSLKKDKEVVLAAVQNFGHNLEYADKSFRKDREVVLAAIKNYGRALNYADDSLKKDKEIVLAAVQNDVYALQYADESLKNDSDIMKMYSKNIK